jgi:hypothetical protein
MVFALLLSGCGKETEDLAKVEVRGRVVFPQDTRSNLIVTFTSQTGRQQRMYQAACSKDRQFKLECPPGSYKVTLTYMPAAPGGTGPAATEKPAKVGTIPARYQNAQDSPWEITVTAAGRKDLVLKLD